jgi:uncharacterized protein (TIGR02118 family)
LHQSQIRVEIEDNGHRCVQNHIRLDVAANRGLPYDGFVELWVDDTAALKALAASAEYDAVAENEKVFADRASIDLTLTEESVMIDGAVLEGAVKRIVALKRRPGMSPEAFQDHWARRHAALIGALPGLCRYAQSRIRLSGYRSDRQPNWDGFESTWFASLDAMAAAGAAPGQDAIRADRAGFIDATKDLVLVVTERVMRG